jgi:hypothetical protein
MTMLVRSIFVWTGCLIAWLVVLPTVAILGGAALFLYATLAEIIGMLSGAKPLDASAIRSTTLRICAGRSLPRVRS